MWNYRIIKHSDGNPENDYYGIHEVFYNKRGKPNSCTKDVIDVLAEDIKGIKWVLSKMKLALGRPVIDFSYFENMEAKAIKAKRRLK
jgi:hypothetical protein